MRRVAVTGVFASALLCALTIGVGGASAGLLGCGRQNFEHPFTGWGDSASYVLAPGGAFEGWNTWKLAGGAQIVRGNDPFYLNSRYDSRSLLLPPGSAATAPAICLQVLSPAFRLVGKSSDGSAVRVTAYTETLLGLLQLPIAADLDLSTQWDASERQQIVLQNLLALTNLGTANVVFRFQPIGGATVQIDDVFVDPLLNY